MRPTVAKIQAVVAAEYGLPARIMREPDGATGVREHGQSHPRQLAMYLSWRLTRHSLKRIGHFFGGRDHSTVIAAREAVVRRCKSDPALHLQVIRLAMQVRH